MRDFPAKGDKSQFFRIAVENYESRTSLVLVPHGAVAVVSIFR